MKLEAYNIPEPNDNAWGQEMSADVLWSLETFKPRQQAPGQYIVKYYTGNLYILPLSAKNYGSDNVIIPGATPGGG